MTEKDIEMFIWDNIKNIDLLRKKGLMLPYGSYYRQFHVFDAGRCDLVCFSKEYRDGMKFLNIHVIEIKKGVAKSNDAIQVIRYISYFEQYKQDLMEQYSADFVSVSGQLIAESFPDWITNISFIVKNRIIFSAHTIKSDGEIRFLNTEIGNVFYKGQIESKKIISSISRPYVEYEFGIFDEDRPMLEDVPF